MYVDEPLPPQQQQQKHPAYRAFLGSLKSKRTKQLYTHYLEKLYLNRPENKTLSLSQILAKSPKEIEYELLGIVEEMRVAELSYSSINLAVIAICHFFEINDVSINKKKISRFKGENINKFEYRAYTHEEIAKLLAALNERDRAAILLMASTGMRVGALPDLKIKHLKKWVLERASSHIYR
ncbi:MAG: hypothetical protein ACTHKJ_08775 [Candidatus Nitrosocosmicus sp.]